MSNSGELVVEFKDVVPVRGWVRALGWLVLVVILGTLGLGLGGWGAGAGALVGGLIAIAIERAWAVHAPPVVLRLSDSELVLPTGAFRRRSVRVPVADVTRAQLSEGHIYIEAGQHACSFGVEQLVGGESTARALVETLVWAVGRVSEQHEQRLREGAALAARLQRRRPWLVFGLALVLFWVSVVTELQGPTWPSGTGAMNTARVVILLAVGVSLERALGAVRLGTVLVAPAAAAMLASWLLGASLALSTGITVLGVALVTLLVLAWVRLRAVLPVELRASGLVVVGLAMFGAAQAWTVTRAGVLPSLVGFVLGFGLSLWASRSKGLPSYAELRHTPRP